MAEKIQIWRMHNEFMGSPYFGQGNIYEYICAHAEDVMLGERQAMFKPDNAVITAFRRCHQPGIMRSRAEIDHKPILRFLKKTDIPLEMPAV